MLVLLVGVVLIALYLYGTRTFGYWSQRGVPHDRPLPFLGTDGPRYLLQRSVTDCAADVYRRYPDERFVGYYRGTTPELVIRDPLLVRQILINDFEFCHPRGLSPSHGRAEPLLRNLFFADGDLWRLLRQGLTPAFGSGKIVAMYPVMAEGARRLQAVLDNTLGEKGESVLDARDVMRSFTTDCMRAVCFGLVADSHNEENSKFKKLGFLRIFTMTVPCAIMAVAKSLFPQIFKNLKYLGQELEDHILRLVRQILKQRDYKHSGQNDFIDLLLERREKGKIVVESLEKPLGPDGKPPLVELKLDDELIAAQVFTFFAAGSETASSATSFTLHQLACHPEIQANIHHQIDYALRFSNGMLTYEGLRSMNWLHLALYEGMRMFPPSGYLQRRVARPYRVPGSGIMLDPGVLITIPIQALNNDPKYWDNPDEFNPERFPYYPDMRKPSSVFMPFGEGPRACIGAQLGQMQSLCGLAAVLQRYRVQLAPGAPRRLRRDPKSIIVQNVLGGIPLLFSRR